MICNETIAAAVSECMIFERYISSFDKFAILKLNTVYQNRG